VVKRGLVGRSNQNMFPLWVGYPEGEVRYGYTREFGKLGVVVG